MELTDTCGACGRKVVRRTDSEEGDLIEVLLAGGEVQHRIGVPEHMADATARLERPPCMRDDCSRAVWMDHEAAGFRA